MCGVSLGSLSIPGVVLSRANIPECHTCIRKNILWWYPLGHLKELVLATEFRLYGLTFGKGFPKSTIITTTYCIYLLVYLKGTMHINWNCLHSKCRVRQKERIFICSPSTGPHIRGNPWSRSVCYGTTQVAGNYGENIFAMSEYLMMTLWWFYTVHKERERRGLVGTPLPIAVLICRLLSIVFQMRS